MEQKTTQRIIGIFVLIALGIVALPLFFNKNESQPVPQTAIVKNTVAPEQSSVTTGQSSLSDSNKSSSDVAQNVVNDDGQKPLGVENDSSIQQQGEPVINQAMSTQLNNSDDSSCTQLVLSPNGSSNNSINNANNTLKANSASPQTIASAVTKNANNNSVVQPSSQAIQTSENNVEQVSNSNLAPTPTPSKSSKKPMLSKNKFHSDNLSAKGNWIIQMGNFRNKNNATRLVELLKTKGFKAFTNTITLSGQPNYRVLVGPESKQISAQALSKEINKKTNMKGIVKPYKSIG